MTTTKPPPRLYTVIFPIEGSGSGQRVLLGLKKRGMGKGLWNGFGGKLEPGETLDDCAHRELQEECGLEAKDLCYVGVLFMICSHHDDLTIFVYTARDLVGSVVESDEMAPQWFTTDKLPYDGCHREARLWWPTMLNGSLFVARFVFTQDDCIQHNIEHVDRARLTQLLSQPGP
ncbi:Nudix (Nucleoside diphosphate linked moiety X)-type motif 1 [Coemansia guatemalensis]|uniref:Oxidized purine nucleoside triphosphate hydrolase n=1 Tax=Coemansia guatemalensis TaxID=2761395 RepID=A0A9W8LQR5_9FUNG|nr:Nudix (Nucleoside diphosphate linked moiety X)-type motif 1 [Coemansia guatemalensis]